MMYLEARHESSYEQVKVAMVSVRLSRCPESGQKLVGSGVGLRAGCLPCEHEA